MRYQNAVLMLPLLVAIAAGCTTMGTGLDPRRPVRARPPLTGRVPMGFLELSTQRCRRQDVQRTVLSDHQRHDSR